MSDRKPPERETVEQTDELLQKSRRLIDELEFILEKLDENPRRVAKDADQKRENRDSARPS